MKKKIIVACDTACDLPEKYKSDIYFLKVPIMLGTVEHFDLTNEEIFEFVKKTGDLPKTAAPSFEYYKSFLLPLADQCEHLIFFSMSKGISAAYSICEGLQRQMDNLTIINSKSLSGGIAIQVMECLKDIEENLKIEQIVENAKNRVDNVASSFVIDTLTYLYKGGRCSSLALLGANLLKIKPQIVMDSNGSMVLAKKFRGKLDVVIKDYIISEFDKIDNLKLNDIVIAYTTKHDNLFEMIKHKFNEIGFKNIYFVRASSTICSHCGENTYGFFYLKK